MTALLKSSDLPPEGVADSPDAQSINLDSLVNRTGIRYPQFRRTLTPRYGKAWLNLSFGYFGLLALGAIAAAVDRNWPAFTVPAILLVGMGMGHVIAYIQLFFHEAAHFNLAPGKALNDILTNLFIGVLTGQNIKKYRIVHFQHHRKLGRTDDTEVSYLDPLNMKLVVSALLGLNTLKGFKTWDRYTHQKSRQGFYDLQLLLGICFNVTLVGLALWLSGPALAGSWILGVLIFFPFFNIIRNLLEHRSYDADPKVDYRQVDHGAIGRMFGDSLLSRFMGGAGFNRHLLHHWEPQVSFTRLPELEAFLAETDCAPILKRNTTTYPRAFIALWGH